MPRSYHALSLDVQKESQMATHDHDEVRPYASPVCYAHEFETNPLSKAEVIAFLNA